ncbi:hypothetical protein [Bacillus sp. Bos-x628]|uniref:hypothetical protein n=1 Tax=Bacillus maqinnsis TaxID=3229854 RepID=UPI00338F89D6
MGDISKVIKDFGNMDAHGNEVKFHGHMVEIMFRFTNKILEFVYILTKEMQRAKNHLEMLSEQAKEEAEQVQ